ncbi:MAG: glycosyltransferase family 39 protein [Anaerolineales bacterium]|nr:MAG: glycosyltransferase family 39 protein [Anaerolineales bacterium]
MNSTTGKITRSILVAILILAGLTARYAGLGFVSIDMEGFLLPWYDEILAGGFSSLGESFSNYTPPYLYLLWIATKTSAFLPKIIAIKSISILFDLLNAFFVYKIISLKYPKGWTAPLGAAIFLTLPTVILNSSFWGQADSIYTGFLLASLYFLLKDRPLPAIVFFGISLSFKAQAVFFSPLLLLLLIRKRIPFLYFVLVPVTYIFLMIPTMLAGRPPMELLTIYFNQAGQYNYLAVNVSNLYVFIPNEYYSQGVILGILIAGVIISLWVAVYAKRIRIFTPEIILFSAFVSVALVPFLLPKMHDRYFYPADVLSLLAIFYFPRLWFLALGYQIISAMAYYVFLVLPPFDPFGITVLSVAALTNLLILGLAAGAQWHIISQGNPNPGADAKNNPYLDTIKNTMKSITTFIQKYRHLIIFVIILAIGIFARMREFGNMPPGLNPDEASIGVEAYYLYKFGVDRYGLSYPVHLISWGSGQNALYAYLLIPFVALKGITPFAVRLPMMLTGILSLILIYIAGRRLFGEKFALLAMFFMAISPWHIVNSRWAVESNIMPFFFLAGFTALTLANTKDWWFLVSSIFFAVSLYSYGTTYVGVPIFLLLTVPLLVRIKHITIKQVIIGAITFVLIALPIGLFLIVNTLRSETLQLGAVTIPRLPVEARYETMAAVFGESPLQALFSNARIMFDVLWKQSDAYPWNFVEPFGYFYKVTFPLVLAGFILTLPFKFVRENRLEHWLIAAWMIASIVVGIVHPVNLTRLNIIFTPILFCIAIFILWLDRRIPYAAAVATSVFMIGFIFFSQAYHGDEYRQRTSAIFNEGIVPAIQYAVQNADPDAMICFTELRYSMYIYILQTQRFHPSEYVDDLEWTEPDDPLDSARILRSLKQFRFKLDDCLDSPDAVYILTLTEEPPNTSLEYRDRRFEKFRVHLPK